MPYSALKVIHHPDRLKVLREGGQPAPTQVQLVISDRCQMACNFCSYRWDGYTSNELFKVIREDGTTDNNPKRFIPYEKCLEILDDCRDMGVCAVQITGGGEPTVHPQHPDIFRAVLDRGLDLALVTNGWALRGEVVALLMDATWVRVSVDAGNAETFARTREVPLGAFHKVWENVGRLCNARDEARSKVVIGIGFVVTRDNYREVVEAATIAKASGADNIRISAVFQPDDAAYFADFHAKAAALCREAEKLTGNGFVVFNNFGDRLADLVQRRPEYQNCGYQHFSTYIAGTQEVFRCCVQAYNPRGLIGSLKGQRFKDLWNSQAKREDFERFDARGCERCMFNNKNRVINYALAREPAHVNFV